MPTQLNIFLSSKMQELRPERDALYELFKTVNDDNINLHIWQFEALDGAPATDKPIRQVYLEALEDSDLYIGLFWNEYGEWTIDEFDSAAEWGIDRQVYVKDVEPEKREQQLTDFLAANGSVTSGLTAKWFKTTSELLNAVKLSIKAWIEERTISRPGSSSALLITDPDDLVERTNVFIGRTDLIIETNELLNKPGPILLQGFGGMGKTALAAEIAAKRLSNGKGPVLWLKAGDEPLETLFEALARPFNKSLEIAAFTGDVQTQAVRQLMRSSGIKLLVLDDVWNGKSLMQLMKALPKDLPVLITSRQRYPSVKIIDIGRLTREESKQLINTYSETNVADSDAVNSLSEKLGDNAFALRIAGMTMAVDKLSASQLLHQIDQAPYDMKVPLSFAGEHEESFSSLLEVSLNSLYLSGRTGKEAHALFLAFGAFFSPSATTELLSLYLEKSIHLSGNAPRTSPTPVEDKLVELQRRGLADRIEATANTINYYRIHDLAYSYAHAQINDALKSIALDSCIMYMSRYNKHTPANFQALLPELNNFMGAAAYALKSEKYKEVENIALSLASSDGNQLFFYAGLNRQATTVLTQALEASKKLFIPEHEAVFLSNLANSYGDLGRLEEALPYYQQALAIVQNRKDKYTEGVILGNIGNIYSNLSMNDQAFNNLEKAYAIAVELNNEDEIARLLTMMGKLYHHEGNYELAIKYYRSAIEIRQSMNEPVKAAAIMGDLGIIYTDLGYYEDAKECYEISLNYAIQTKNRQSEGTGLDNVGSIYTKLHQYQTAIECHNKALSIALEMGDRYLEGIIYGGLANAYKGLELFDKAIEYYNRSLSINEEVGNRRGAAIQYGNLVAIYVTIGQYDLAFSNSNKALDITREIADKAMEGSLLGNMGSIYYSLNDYENAMTYYVDAANLGAAIGNDYMVAMMYTNIGRIYNQWGMLQEAYNSFEQALKIYTNLQMKDNIIETQHYVELLGKALGL